MNNLLENTFKREQLWPTIASFVIPAIQLIAVIIVDINDTLQLKVLFINSEILPIANLLALMLIAASIGFYWYWKENYSWLSIGSEKYVSYQRKIRNFLLTAIITAVIAAVIIIISLILGRSSLEDSERFITFVATVQIISYVIFVYMIGIITYIGLSEYSKKQKDYKPEQYLNNLLSSMQYYGTIPRPNIHVKERKTLFDKQMNTLVNLTINGEEKYLITTYNGKEIVKELSAAEYRQSTVQQPTQPQQPPSDSSSSTL